MNKFTVHQIKTANPLLDNKKMANQLQVKDQVYFIKNFGKKFVTQSRHQVIWIKNYIMEDTVIVHQLSISSQSITQQNYRWIFLCMGGFIQFVGVYLQYQHGIFIYIFIFNLFLFKPIFMPINRMFKFIILQYVLIQSPNQFLEACLFYKMNPENNLEYVAMIKDQYLPPPLQNSYLSLFDIQVKLAKEFLEGTEEEKILTIKKRIKKFFDYGNDSADGEQLSFNLSKTKKVQYPRFETDLKDLRNNFEIDCTRLILYSKDLVNFQVAEKLFPGFISYVKIDDCNVELKFTDILKCQAQLYNNVKIKDTLVSQHICYPTFIQWFQLGTDSQQRKSQDQQQNQPCKNIFARFATNKDNILFRNDIYFRRLLGKVRQIVDKKQLQNQNRQKQLQQRAERQKARKLQKTKHISKCFNDKKYKRDFDSITNYDGLYPQRSIQYSRQSNNHCPQDYQRKRYNRKKNDKYSRYFDNLNLSQIRHVPIQLQENRKKKSLSRKHHRSSSRDSIDFSANNQKFLRKETKEPNTRDQLIKAHRQRTPSLKRGKHLSSYDYDKQYMKIVQDSVTKGQKRRYDID